MMNRAIAAILLSMFATAATAEVVEAVIARVGDRIITRSQYVTRLSDGYQEIERTTPPAGVAERKKEFQDKLFNEMIAELLLKDRADRLGLTVTNDEVAEAVKRMMQQYNITDEAEFEQSLAQSGLTRSEMESRLRDTILTNKVFSRELRSRADLSDKELRARYDREKEEHRLPERAVLREIVVVIEPGADAAPLLARAEEAARRARAGEDFATLAGELSDSPSKSKGGDIGTVAKGELLASLDEAVFNDPAATIVGPIETPAGYHVLSVEKRIPSEIPPFDQVKETLRREANDETFQRDYEAYIQKLRKEAFVKVNEENLPRG